jgi:hypothetical protein
MYLGIDFLIAPDLRPFVIEVNVGLPGGAQEHDLACRVRTGRASGVFQKIEAVSLEVYGKTFRECLQSLGWIESLKKFKLWMDGQGPLPETRHPGLRLEDKWVQYQILSPLVPLPETLLFDPGNLPQAERFLAQKGRLVAKRRLGRGGRDFRVIDHPKDLAEVAVGAYGAILQEWLDSRVAAYAFSIRSVAFGGEPICMYANLASRKYSNHGILAYVEPGDRLGLSAGEFATRSFSQRSWEAEIWFGQTEPSYLHHNLYEDEVATVALILPGELIAAIREISVRVERFYESFDLAALPRALFE